MIEFLTTAYFLIEVKLIKKNKLSTAVLLNYLLQRVSVDVDFRAYECLTERKNVEIYNNSSLETKV